MAVIRQTVRRAKEYGCVDKRPRTRARRRLCRGVWGAGGNGIEEKCHVNTQEKGAFRNQSGGRTVVCGGGESGGSAEGPHCREGRSVPGSRAGAWVRCLTCLASLKLAASTLWL